MKNIKTIIFDYGNIIGNDPSGYIYKAVSEEFNLDINQIKNEFFKFIFKLEKNQIPEQIFWKNFSKNLGINDYKKLKRIWIWEFKKQSKINKDIVTLLKKLKTTYKLCLLSNNAVFYQKTSIGNLLKKIFNAIIYSYKVKMRKPEKNIYLYTMKKMKSKPSECLIVDDNKKHLFHPKKLKMETIHFKSFIQLKKELDEKLNDRDQLINKFVNLLKRIKRNSEQQKNFAGMGLVLYESKYFSKIPRFNLRPSMQYRKNIKINTARTPNFFLKISQNNNSLHDGFHFINEEGVLTHIAQYFVPPLRKIKPVESKGVRYHAAILGSRIKGVILTSVVDRDSKGSYFKNGKIYKI